MSAHVPTTNHVSFMDAFVLDSQYAEIRIRIMHEFAVLLAPD